MNDRSPLRLGRLLAVAAALSLGMWLATEGLMGYWVSGGGFDIQAGHRLGQLTGAADGLRRLSLLFRGRSLERGVFGRERIRGLAFRKLAQRLERLAAGCDDLFLFAKYEGSVFAF